MTRRPFLAGEVASLRNDPLDPTTVARVTRARLVIEDEPFEVTVETPALASDAPGLDASVLPPDSLEIEREPLRDLVPTDASPAPSMVSVETAKFEWDGSTLRARVLFGDGTSFYGAGMVAGPLLRNQGSKGRCVTFWNTDAWCYGEETPALYQSHPFVLAVRKDGSAVGLLADTARRGQALIGTDGVEFAAEGVPFELYRIEAAHPLDVVRGLTHLVGRPSLPPLWSLGYHQCRWSYASADELRELASEMRARRIPCDALWFDIDHMDRFRVFTWNPETFPDPKGLTDELRAQGFRSVAILDPGIAVADDYDVHRELIDGGHHVRKADGAPAQGRVWPGICRFPDFTSAVTREWWSERVARHVANSGLDGLWTDMNEPSLFRTPSKTLPDDAVHADGTHAEVHNLYGQRMVEATRTGFERARPDARPFVLTRSNHVAGSRFAATWTGDNQSRWDDLRWSLTMTLSLALSGQPFAGPDVGGFYGDPSPELFVRWFEAASLLPFFRGHSEKTSCRKEPWSLGVEAEAHVRRAIERRMELLPTLYTLAWRACAASRMGEPLVRPVFFADPSDADLRAIDDAYLLGHSLLVAPVLEEAATTRDVRFPRGDWYSVETGERYHGGRIRRIEAPLGTLPLFARAGTVLPTCPARETAGSWTGGFGDDLLLRVFPDEAGGATGELYEDAGDGLAYRGGDFLHARFEARVSENEIELSAIGTGVRWSVDRTWRTELGVAK